MRILFVIFVAVIAFAAGVWYMGGFDAPAQTLGPNIPDMRGTDTDVPATSTPRIMYDNADANAIVVTAPAPGATVASTFTVSGKARGNWYFEASFPLEVQDANGNALLQVPVQADGDWMTTEFVPFTMQVTVPDYTGKATLILHKDNPSGLPDKEASVSIPITIH